MKLVAQDKAAQENATQQNESAVKAPLSGAATLNNDEQASFDLFKAWNKIYSKAANPGEKSALEPRGLELACARESAMLKLIVSDPERAIQLAYPASARQALPPAIAEHVESPISGRGEFAVIAVDQIDRKTGKMTGRIRRTISLGDTSYIASVYGRRLKVTTKKLLAVSGVVLGRYIGIRPSPVLRLAADDILSDSKLLASIDRNCPICDKPVTRGIFADVGGVIVRFDSEQHLREFEMRIQAAEDIVDPHSTGLDVAQ